MNDSDDANAAGTIALLLIVVLVVATVASFCAGSAGSEAVARQKAVQAKVGRWVLDGETGRKVFVYGCEHVAKGRESEEQR